MKTLKKTLCLVLAVVMVVGVMVLPASADYVDADKIENKEAVAVLTGLGVLTGDEGGFRPTDTLKRAEAVTIIAKMLLGPDTVKLLPGAKSFSDVTASYWGSGAINYCSTMGVVSGFGDGTFRPEEKVTGYQFGKMVLVALGEDGTKYTGDGWELRVVTDLRKHDLDADVTSGKISDQPLERQIAAQMSFNTLMSTKVESRGTWTVSPDGQITFTPGNEGDYAPLYQTVFKGATTNNSGVTNLYALGVLTACADNDADSADDGTITINVPSGNSTALRTFKGEAGLDLIGHQVKVYYTTTGRGNTNGVVYAVVDAAKKVSTVTCEGSKFAASVAAAGFDADTLAAANKMVNYTAGTQTLSDPNVAVIVISNHDDLRVDYTIQLKTQVAMISNITTRTDNDKTVITYNFVAENYTKKYTNAVVSTKDTLEKGDIVRVTEIGDGTVVNVEKAEILTGVYSGSAVSATGVRTFTLGGTAYQQASTPSLTSAQDTKFLGSIPAAGTGTLGIEYNFVLDTFGKVTAIWAKDANVNSRGYAYLAAFGVGTEVNELGAPSQKLMGLLYFSDGTSELVYIDTATGSSTTDNPFWHAMYSTQTDTLNQANNPAAVHYGGLYSVTLSSNDSYLLKAPSANTIAIVGNDDDTSAGSSENDDTSVTVKSGSNVVGLTAATSGANVYGNPDSVTFIVTGIYGNTTNPLSVKVVHGVAGLVGQKVKTGYYNTVGGTNVYTAGLIDSVSAQIVDQTIYYYTGKYSTTTTAEGTVYAYEAYLKGEKTTLSSKTLYAGTAGFVNVNDQGGLVPVPAANVTGTAKYVNEYYQGTLVVATDLAGTGSKAVAITDDVISDITGNNFTSFNEAGVTIEVAVVFNTEGGVNKALAVYVTSVKSNDSVMNMDESGQFTVNNTDHSIKITLPAEGSVTWAKLNALKPAGSTIYKVSASGTHTINDIFDGTNLKEGVMQVGGSVADHKIDLTTALTAETFYLVVVAADNITCTDYTLTVTAAGA